MNEKANRIILHTKIGKKFINLLMVNGQKNKAEQIFLQTLELLGQNAVYTLLEALKNVRPILEVRSIRLRGANYQVPVPLTENRRMSLAIKWIIGTARKKTGRSMNRRLQDELLLAQKKQGESVKKKIAIHRTACSHRAFTHYRWF